MTEQKYDSFRWVMLGMGCFIQMLSSWGTMIVPSLAKPIMADLDLSYTMLMSISQAATIAGIFLAVLGGAFTDKLGIKNDYYFGVDKRRIWASKRLFY